MAVESVHLRVRPHVPHGVDKWQATIIINFKHMKSLTQ